MPIYKIYIEIEEDEDIIDIQHSMELILRDELNVVEMNIEEIDDDDNLFNNFYIIEEDN